MNYKYKDVYAAAAEVLGMVLSYMDEKEHVSLVAGVLDCIVYTVALCVCCCM